MGRFKVGDRVRALDSCGSGGFVEGDEYTVSRVYEDYDGPRIKVAVDSTGSTSNGWGAHHFELAPLRIETGKFYRTRDGRKVGPMRATDGGWTADGGMRIYKDNGKRIFGDYEDTWLAAEWPTYNANPAAEVDNLRDEYGPVGANDNSTAGFTVPVFDEDDAPIRYEDGKFIANAASFVPPVAEATSGKDVAPPTGDKLVAADYLVKSGVCTIDEVRAVLGYGPLPSGGHTLASAA